MGMKKEKWKTDERDGIEADESVTKKMRIY